MPVVRPDRSLGVNQQWTDVTATRALGVTYTNNTGRTIAIAVNTEALQDGAAATLTVDGKPLSFHQSGTNVATDVTHSAVIPQGSTYRLDQAVAGTIGIGNWFELRR